MLLNGKPLSGSLTISQYLLEKSHPELFGNNDLEKAAIYETAVDSLSLLLTSARETTLSVREYNVEIK